MPEPPTSSVHVNETVTSLVYQPLLPDVPADTAALIVGGTWSGAST